MLISLVVAATLTAGPSFIEDDYGRALATAKKQKKVLFVDAWAPWCHTCIFMREHVLSQSAFSAFEKQLVFAAVDTEKAKSAPFLEKFPVDVWPSYYFIDPTTERVLFKWIGSADATQMKALLEAAQGKGAAAEADALFAQGKTAEAVEKYTALKSTPEARATLSMLSALSAAKKLEACAKTADEQAPKLTGASDRIGALTWGLSCAVALDASPSSAALLASQVAQAKAALKLEGAMADDVSGLYELLVEERTRAKDVMAAEALAKEWLTYLEGEAKKAPSPAARAVFDPHRVSAALAAHQPERSLDALAQSEKDFPKDYNPPARLALLYRELGKLDDAAAAIDRALSRCSEGPRCLRLFEVKASVAERKGDVALQKKTLGAAVAWAKKLPRAQVSEQRIAGLQAALEKTGAAKVP